VVITEVATRRAKQKGLEVNMCGIVGVLAYGDLDKKLEKTRQEAMIYFATELLQLTQPRGKDATGIATLFANCDYMGLKMGVPAMDFVSRFGGEDTDFEGFTKVWRAKTTPAKAVIGHCRKPSATTNAGAEDNNNNHPIKVGDIVGIHNGTLTNHEKILTQLGGKRDGKVDSEAIFRLLHKITNNGTEPFTTGGLTELVNRLHGSYSCLSFSGNNPFQLVGFLDQRPMVFALIRPLKLLLVASDMDFLKEILFMYNKTAKLYGGGIGKFPALKKDDVETLTAANLSAFVFDLRIDVTPETKITDLMEKVDIVLADRIWGPVTKTYGNKNYSRHQGNRAGKKAAKKQAGTVLAKKTEVDAKPASGSATNASNSNRNGMAFNDEKGEFQTVKKNEDVGEVVADVDNNEVIDAKKGTVLAKDGGEKKSNADIASSSQDKAPCNLVRCDEPVDSLLDSAAKVVQVDVKTPEPDEAIIAVHKGGVTTVPEAERKEVDFTTHPDVLELANNAAKEEPSFSNDIELADALEIASPEILGGMDAYSLGNRVKRFFLRKGYYMGYLAALAGENLPTSFARTVMIRSKAKQRIAQKTIRNMKSVVSVMSGMISKVALNSTVDNAVAKAFEQRKELSHEALLRVFKPGDLRSDRVLESLIDSVKEKEGRKDG